MQERSCPRSVFSEHCTSDISHGCFTIQMPASLSTFAAVDVEYETMPGWTEDISKAKRFEDLPPNCQVSFLNCLNFIFDMPNLSSR